jgi:hypothetical protein
MTRRVPILPTLLMIGLALTVAAVAFASELPSASHPQGGPRLEFAPNQLRLAQTSPNQALIRLPKAKPGQIAKGSTRLTVISARAALTVKATNLTDTPGPNGGSLIASKRLWIAVSCTGQPCPGSGVAYQGPLSNMGTRSLGIWRAATSRTYTVRVWLLRGPTPLSNTTGDNVFQGSRARFGLVWTATAL